jgi:outer membrane scaffolding protein for murein synthesis (MipA/OmpV family)
LGAGALFQPKYEGAKDYKVMPLPYGSVSYKDRVELNTRGLSVKVLEAGPLRFDARLGYELGRDASDSPRLRGMGDVDFAATVGGRVAYRFGGAEVFAEAAQALGGSEGLTGELGVSYQHQLGDSWIFGVSASGTLADDRYMRSYFGVSAAQSAASGLARHETSGGLKSLQAGVNATYLFGGGWFLRGEAGLSALMSDAADSPVVERRTTPTGLLMLGYRF